MRRNHEPVARPHDILAAVQGSYAAEVLLQLSRTGVLAGLAEPATSRQLSTRLRLAPRLLDELLEFVERTTDMLVRDARGRYRLASPETLGQLSFQLEKFLGAYGAAVRGLAGALRGADPARVDGRALARAFAQVGDAGSPVAEMVSATGALGVLDLGTGPASLLIELATRNPRFHGFGVDSSPAMVRLARRRARERGLDGRVRISRGDGRHPEAAVPRGDRPRIDTLHARSFLNELFWRGDAEAVAVLRRLRRLFPGRTAWFVDYYGELGRRRRDLVQCRLTLLQDLAQVVSRQGVPPATRKEWQNVYAKAGCILRESHDFEADGIRWFIHRVEL